jgi:hypothetical protein
MKAVSPCFVKMNRCGTVNMWLDVVEVMDHFYLSASSFSMTRICVYEMPEFQPNEYLLKTHADKGKDDWEIYAWAVRDAMSKASGFGTCDHPLRNKVEYEKFLNK